ncbi:MAG TPA: thioredoxin family protein [Actinomycetota bacterium]|nr:thioredoxin family protein [Actinomycetota bacterium]
MGAPTTTEPIAVGAPGLHFEGLRGVDGAMHDLSEFSNAELLAIIFISTGCPTVRAYEDRLSELQAAFGHRGLQVVAVNANDPHLSPGDSLERMTERAQQTGFGIPYLRDNDGELARSLGAVCTPHAFLFDGSRVLRYRGRVDDARLPENVTTRDLQAAVEDLLAGRDPGVAETEPFGCSIVWGR